MPSDSECSIRREIVQFMIDIDKFPCHFSEFNLQKFINIDLGLEDFKTNGIFDYWAVGRAPN